MCMLLLACVTGFPTFYTSVRFAWGSYPDSGGFSTQNTATYHAQYYVHLLYVPLFYFLTARILVRVHKLLLN